MLLQIKRLRDCPILVADVQLCKNQLLWPFRKAVSGLLFRVFPSQQSILSLKNKNAKGYHNLIENVKCLLSCFIQIKRSSRSKKYFSKSYVLAQFSWAICIIILSGSVFCQPWLSYHLHCVLSSTFFKSISFESIFHLSLSVILLALGSSVTQQDMIMLPVVNLTYMWMKTYLFSRDFAIYEIYLSVFCIYLPKKQKQKP